MRAKSTGTILGIYEGNEEAIGSAEIVASANRPAEVYLWDEDRSSVILATYLYEPSEVRGETEDRTG